jgi:hypothetical protein
MKLLPAVNLISRAPRVEHHDPPDRQYLKRHEERAAISPTRGGSAVDDERIERARRNFRYSHTELDPPSTLREHLDELEEAGGPVAVSGPAVVEPVTRPVPTSATSGRGLARVIAAIAALVAFVGGGLIFGLSLRSGLPITESASPVPFTDTNGSPSVPPPTGASVFTWTLVSSDEKRATYAIARAGDGWIGLAFGQESRTEHSEDGVTWVVDPPDPGLLAAPADHLTLVNGLASAAHGFVAVGASALFDISSGLVQAWTSTDGLHWTAAARIGGDSNAAMQAVVAGPDGYVAVGSDGFPGGNVQLPGAHGAATWSSADGARWVRSPGQASFAGAIMTGVARTGNGYVAWGEIIPNSTIPGQALPIWTSPDGVSWTRTGSGRSETSFSPIGRIVVMADRWVAVGTRPAPEADGGGSKAAAWVSTNAGRTWGTVTVATSGASPSNYAFDVGAVGPDLLAVGHADGPDATNGQTTAAAWRSADEGATWTRLPDDPTFNMALMTGVLPLDDNRFVVFGEANDPNALVNPNLIWLATRQP